MCCIVFSCIDSTSIVHATGNVHLLQLCICPHPYLLKDIVPAPVASISLPENVQRDCCQCESKSQPTPDIEDLAWPCRSRPIVDEVAVSEEEEVLKHHVGDEHLAAQVAESVYHVAVGWCKDKDHA